MAKRINAFDWIRVISLLGILLCHSCFEWRGCGWLGRYLAQTFNLIFLILSAFLMGISWENKGYATLEKSFVTKRIKRLTKTYYPYLIVVVLFVFLTDGYLVWHKILANFLYLSWFDTIGGFGHLWYLTMIVLCYCACWAITKVDAIKWTVIGKRGILPMLLFSAVFLLFASFSTLNGVPGAVFIYLLLYLLVFGNASKIIKALGMVPLWCWVVLTVAIHLPALKLYHDGLFSMRLLSYFVSIATAFTLFGLLLAVFRNVREIGVITFLSGLSFEAYLVHEFFLGRISVYHFCNQYIGYALLVAASVLSGFLLIHLSSAVSRLFEKRR